MAANFAKLPSRLRREQRRSFPGGVGRPLVNFVRRFFDVQSVNLATVRCRKMQNGVIFKPLRMQNGIHIHVDLVTLSHPI
jgi:hypothetical protein